jgi:hypothetical protein
MLLARIGKTWVRPENILEVQEFYDDEQNRNLVNVTVRSPQGGLKMLTVEKSDVSKEIFYNWPKK